jgi:hypothetical protein
MQPVQGLEAFGESVLLKIDGFITGISPAGGPFALLTFPSVIHNYTGVAQFGFFSTNDSTVIFTFGDEDQHIPLQIVPFGTSTPFHLYFAKPKHLLFFFFFFF